jgi:glucose-6-phosphate isomerase
VEGVEITEQLAFCQQGPWALHLRLPLQPAGRGHLHVPNNRPELSYVMSGEGVMLLAEVLPGTTNALGTERVGLSPGLVANVDGRYVHRTVNTRAIDLVFFSIWPADTGHEYETTARTGFWERVTG